MARKFSNFFPFRKKKRQQMWKKDSTLVGNVQSDYEEELEPVVEDESVASNSNGIVETIDAIEDDSVEKDSIENVSIEGELDKIIEPGESDPLVEPAVSDAPEAEAAEVFAEEESSLADELPLVMLPEKEEKIPHEPERNLLHDFHRVEGSVEKFKKEALTAGELRRTIEGAVEKRFKDLAEGIKELFHQKYETSSRTGDDALVNAVQVVRSEIEEVARDIQKISIDLPSKSDKEKSEERFLMLEDRLVAWLERINVNVKSQEKKSSSHQLEMSSNQSELRSNQLELRGLIGELLQRKRDNDQIRKRFYGIKGALSASLSKLRTIMSDNLIARMFLAGSMEPTLQSIQAALAEFESVLREFED